MTIRFIGSHVRLNQRGLDQQGDRISYLFLFIFLVFFFFLNSRTVFADHFCFRATFQHQRRVNSSVRGDRLTSGVSVICSRSDSVCSAVRRAWSARRLLGKAPVSPNHPNICGDNRGLTFASSSAITPTTSATWVPTELWTVTGPD